MRNHWRRTTVTSKKGGEERWHQGRAWSREEVVHELAVQLVSWLLCIHSFYLHTLQSLTSLTLQSKQCSALSKVFCRAPPSLTSRLSCNLIKNAQPCLITPSFFDGPQGDQVQLCFSLEEPFITYWLPLRFMVSQDASFMLSLFCQSLHLKRHLSNVSIN